MEAFKHAGGVGLHAGQHVLVGVDREHGCRVPEAFEYQSGRTVGFDVATWHTLEVTPTTAARVIVGSGDQVTVVHRPTHDVTVSAVARVGEGDSTLVPDLLMAPELADGWVSWAVERAVRSLGVTLPTVGTGWPAQSTPTRRR